MQIRIRMPSGGGRGGTGRDEARQNRSDPEHLLSKRLRDLAQTSDYTSVLTYR